MATEPEVIRGIGHSVRRVEDDRFIRGAGNYIDDINLPGMLYMAILRSPYAHAKLNGIDASKAQALPGVIAVVTGELMAQHNLAWMPTLSGDTQAVLVTDTVRFQGQEVAAVVATDPYIAKDALELIDVDYEPLEPVVTPQRAMEADAPVHPHGQGRPEGQPHLPLGDRRQGGHGQGLRRRRGRGQARHLLPPLSPLAAGDVRLHRRHQPGHGTGEHLHDVAGAARHPHRLRAGGRAPRGEDPDHLPRHRRRVRQQGARVPGLRRGHGRVAAAGSSREVDRGALGEPHLHRVRPRLPHARRDGAEEGRHHARAAHLAAGGRGRVLRGRAALEVQGGAVPHRERVLRPAGGARIRGRARTRTRRRAAWRTAARSASRRPPT